MDHGTVLTVFVVIAAIALVIQAAMLAGLFLIAQKIHRRVSEADGGLKRQADLAVQVLEIIASAREPIRLTVANMVEVSRIIRERTGQLDEAFGDLTVRSRDQLVRIDQLVEDLIAKVDSTANAIQRSVISPFREVFAVGKGVQTALDIMFSRRRPSSVSHATQDEEMFI